MSSRDYQQFLSLSYFNLNLLLENFVTLLFYIHCHNNVFLIFFEGLYSSRKLNIKNFKIKRRIIKSLMKEEKFHEFVLFFSKIFFEELYQIFTSIFFIHYTIHFNPTPDILVKLKILRFHSSFFFVSIVFFLLMILG